ncbi:hypothetical protein F5Y19DRAFT_479687 [Xylariaceae sp. FL1651]|nr:hypothetical protein F5Y19DRAFT_479687 [Xylariaceae sp. FL1651]
MGSYDKAVRAARRDQGGHVQDAARRVRRLPERARSVVAEVWRLLTEGPGLSYEEVGDIFKSWNEKGPLHDCFLIIIGVDMERTKDKSGQHLVSQVRAKVVQDVNKKEGAGI